MISLRRFEAFAQSRARSKSTRNLLSFLISLSVSFPAVGFAPSPAVDLYISLSALLLCLHRFPGCFILQNSRTRLIVAHFDIWPNSFDTKYTNSPHFESIFSDLTSLRTLIAWCCTLPSFPPMTEPPLYLNPISSPEAPTNNYELIGVNNPHSKKACLVGLD